MPCSLCRAVGHNKRTCPSAKTAPIAPIATPAAEQFALRIKSDDINILLKFSNPIGDILKVEGAEGLPAGWTFQKSVGLVLSAGTQYIASIYYEDGKFTVFYLGEDEGEDDRIKKYKTLPANKPRVLNINDLSEFLDAE
jgi:hypothetical protein